MKYYTIITIITLFSISSDIDAKENPLINKWITLSASSQNLHEGLSDLQGGDPDLSSHEADLKKVDDALNELVKSGVLVSKRINLKFLNKEDGEALRKLFNSTEGLRIKYGFYTAIEMCDLADSRLVALAGGRIFPGMHHLSKFTVSDEDQQISMQVDAVDGAQPLVDIEVRETNSFQEGSVFASLEASSEFFEAGCIGYSSRSDGCMLDGLLLEVPEWQVSALTVDSVSSSYFDDESVFPVGSIEFDHALLMRDIDHEWHTEPSMKMV